MAFLSSNGARWLVVLACSLAALLVASYGCMSPRKATVQLTKQARDASSSPESSGSRLDGTCLVREKLVPVVAGPIGPTWPNISKPASRVGNRGKDSAVVVALEGDARAPIRIGANVTAQAWSEYFTQTLGMSTEHVHVVSFAEIGRKSVKVALDAAAKQAGQGGRLWMLFIGRGRVGCPSSSAAGSRCSPQLWLELASAEQRTPEPREWALNELQGYVTQRNAAPVVIADVVAAMPEQATEAKSAVPVAPIKLAAPSRGVTLALVHPVRPVVARVGYTYPLSTKWMHTGGARREDVTWPLALAGSGVLPGTSGPAFSQLLLAGLRGWADRNADGNVTADEAVQQVRDALVKAAPTISGVPIAIGPGSNSVLVPVAEKQYPVLQAPEPRVIGGHPVLFNAASRVLPAKAGPTAGEVDWHMFDDIGDTSRLTSYKDIPIGLNPREFFDEQGDYEGNARHVGQDLKDSYKKYPDGPRVDTRIGGWCAAAYFGRLAPFRHEAWRHCASFVSHASMQLLIWAEIEKDWRQLDGLLRMETTQATDGFALLRHFLERYPTLKEMNVLDGCETTCQRMVHRREGKPPPGADLGPNEWVYVPGASMTYNGIEPAFEIQRTEVTNAQYDRCVQSGACTGVVYDSAWMKGAVVEPKNGAQAVVGVDWDQARGFCRWVGGDLPTGAQWWHAAEMGEGAPVEPFAWVHSNDICSAVVIASSSQYSKCNPLPKGPAPVCSTPRSNSPLGLCDMVGNVTEWVSDAEVDASTGKSNRTIQGQNWRDGRIDPYSDTLPLFASIAPTTRSSTIGFRCMRPAR